MVAGRTGIIIGLMVLCCSVGLAQTPTPLPGTPQALTCVSFGHSGLPSVQVIGSWEYLDRACIVLENTTGEAIELAAVQGYFGQVSNALITQIRIWEVLNEGFLPDIPAAAVQISDTYGFSVDPISGSPPPDAALITFDLEGYPGVPMPVINPNKKFIIDFINLLDEGGGGPPGMKVSAEQSGLCPPAFWSTGTNIFGNQAGSTLTWNFKEDIGDPTNYFLGVTYYDNATPRTPAMGTIGLIALLMFVSIGLMRRRK